MATPLNTIFTWFETGDFPTEAQFQATFSSFWHKDQLIPFGRIDGLAGLFENTVNLQMFYAHVNDPNAHAHLARRDASNLSPTDIAEWKIVLGLEDIGQNINRVPTATYAELGITPESSTEEKQAAIANFLEGYDNGGEDVLHFEITEGTETEPEYNFDVTANWNNTTLYKNSAYIYNFAVTDKATFAEWLTHGVDNLLYEYYSENEITEFSLVAGRLQAFIINPSEQG